MGIREHLLAGPLGFGAAPLGNMFRNIPDADGLVGRFFSPAEQAEYRSLPAERRMTAFFRGWVCKEAVIKAAGASVQYLDGFDVRLDTETCSPAAVADVIAGMLAAD